jgi:hypothetical protein
LDRIFKVHHLDNVHNMAYDVSRKANEELIKKEERTMEFQTVINVNGKVYLKEHSVWMNAFMYATDTINILKRQPSFLNPNTSIEVKITDSNGLAATYTDIAGWKFN